MKHSFKKALKIFKYLSILFILIYWMYILLDDYQFIKKYWTENWIEYVEIWSTYFMTYLLTFSIYYWFVASVIVLVYHKIYLKIKNVRK